MKGLLVAVCEGGAYKKELPRLNLMQSPVKSSWRTEEIAFEHIIIYTDSIVQHCLGGDPSIPYICYHLCLRICLDKMFHQFFYFHFSKFIALICSSLQ